MTTGSKMVKGYRFRRAAGAATLLASAGLLTACDTVGEALGLSRARPDEFQVVARAPLEVPPDFNLRPPQPGSPRPQELERDTRVTASVFGATGAGLFDPRTSTSQSTGEGALLSEAGADRADSQIRAIVDRENPGVVVADRGFLDRLMFWQRPAPGAQPAAATPAPAAGAAPPAPAATKPPAQAVAAPPPPKQERGFFSRLMFWKDDSPAAQSDAAPGQPSVTRTGSGPAGTVGAQPAPVGTPEVKPPSDANVTFRGALGNRPEAPAEETKPEQPPPEPKKP